MKENNSSGIRVPQTEAEPDPKLYVVAYFDLVGQRDQLKGIAASPKDR